jgi:hypothetical protein
MTPKEKANYLIRKMTVDFTIEYAQSKLCAVVCCDEIINVHYKLKCDESHMGDSYRYWQDVKKELELL